MIEFSTNFESKNDNLVNFTNGNGLSELNFPNFEKYDRIFIRLNQFNKMQKEEYQKSHFFKRYLGSSDIENSIFLRVVSLTSCQ